MQNKEGDKSQRRQSNLFNSPSKIEFYSVDEMRRKQKEQELLETQNSDDLSSQEHQGQPVTRRLDFGGDTAETEKKTRVTRIKSPTETLQQQRASGAKQPSLIVTRPKAKTVTVPVTVPVTVTTSVTSPVTNKVTDTATNTATNTATYTRKWDSDVTTMEPTETPNRNSPLVQHVTTGRVPEQTTKSAIEPATDLDADDKGKSKASDETESGEETDDSDDETFGSLESDFSEEIPSEESSGEVIPLNQTLSKNNVIKNN